VDGVGLDVQVIGKYAHILFISRAGSGGQSLRRSDCLGLVFWKQGDFEQMHEKRFRVLRNLLAALAVVTVYFVQVVTVSGITISATSAPAESRRGRGGRGRGRGGRRRGWRGGRWGWDCWIAPGIWVPC